MKINDLINQNSQIWRDYIAHEFVVCISKGSLSKEAYKHYLIQDYHFLCHYIRAYALGIFKSENLEDVSFFNQSIKELANCEIYHHIKYCEKFGITKAKMDATDEESGTISYTRYLLDVGNLYGVDEILTALAPCAIGYARMANLIGTEIERNFSDIDYNEWIEIYKGSEFQDASAKFEEIFNSKMKSIELNSKKGKLLDKIFRTATIAEIGFWEQSIKFNK